MDFSMCQSVAEKMMNLYESTCLRCGQTVYQVDRVGPLKDFTFFHQGCFKCAVCGTKLTLKTYYNNQDSSEDKEVYCVSHVPKIGPGHLDGSAVGIRSALNVPKSFNYVNEQIRGGGKGTFDAEALAIRTHLGGTRSENGHHFTEHQYGRFDASALHIAHALRATEIQRSYQRPQEKPLESYLVSLLHNNNNNNNNTKNDSSSSKINKERDQSIWHTSRTAADFFSLSN